MARGQAPAGCQSSGEIRLTPRLFLVAPEKPVAHFTACLVQACAVGDVASLLVPASIAREVTPIAQSRGIAVIVDGDARDATRDGCDGVQVEATAEAVAAARAALGKNHIVGAFAGDSRHYAMEAADAGADYVALSQLGATMGGEPIVSWWSALMEIPCVAFDPALPEDLDILLPQKPDFIRPTNHMWESPEAARTAIQAITQRLNET